jgi:hypothetical protein
MSSKKNKTLSRNTDLNSLFAGDGSKHICRPLLTMDMDELKKHPREIHGCKATRRYTTTIELTRARIRYDALLSLRNICETMVESVAMYL